MGMPIQVKMGVYQHRNRDTVAMDITKDTIFSAKDRTSGIEVMNTEYWVFLALVVAAARAFLKMPMVYLPGRASSGVWTTPLRYTSFFQHRGGMRMTMMARIKTMIREHSTAGPYIYSVPVMETSRAKKPRDTTEKLVEIQQASFSV